MTLTWDLIGIVDELRGTPLAAAAEAGLRRDGGARLLDARADLYPSSSLLDLAGVRPDLVEPDGGVR